MSSKDGARNRFPGKGKPVQKKKDGKRELTEEEAVSKASSKWITHFLLALVLSLVTPLMVLTFLPSPIKPKEYPRLSPPQSLIGPLAPNNHLAQAEKIYEDIVVGPESMVIDGDTIYTGTMDGWVNILHKGELKRLVTFGQEPCGGLENENTCGRPLGMRLDKDGHLVVCDAYHGLFRVDVTTGQYETLYLPTTVVNGQMSSFLNDLDIDSQDRIYFTDSSTEWHRNQFTNIIMEGEATGRLLMYNPKTKRTTQLRGDMMFPNGVQLTPDQSAVLVTELCRARIVKYDLASKRSSIWADGLPGNPDNIRYDNTSQTYWVGMGIVRYVDRLSVFDYFAVRPWLRGIAAKVLSASNALTMKSFLKHFSSAEPLAMAVEMDANGYIVSSVQDRRADVVQSVSEVHVSNGVMYMGSYDANFIARLDMKKMKPV